MGANMTAERPPIMITAGELSRLTPLARGERTAGARLLGQKLEPAKIILGGPRPGVAHLDSVFTYLDRAHRCERTIHLIVPEEARPATAAFSSSVLSARRSSDRKRETLSAGEHRPTTSSTSRISASAGAMRPARRRRPQFPPGTDLPTELSGGHGPFSASRFAA